MAELIVIAAVAKNFVIGKDNDIPWRIKEDFDYFKEKTLGYPCIMGDRTYESLPENAKPLPGRENIVLTFKKDYSSEGITVINDFDKALEYVKTQEKAFICGGATIYKLGLPVADTLMLTMIDKDFEGDTYFPKVNFDEWELTSKQDMVDEIHGDYSFRVYKRK